MMALDVYHNGSDSNPNFGNSQVKLLREISIGERRHHPCRPEVNRHKTTLTLVCFASIRGGIVHEKNAIFLNNT